MVNEVSASKENSPAFVLVNTHATSNSLVNHNNNAVHICREPNMPTKSPTEVIANYQHKNQPEEIECTTNKSFSPEQLSMLTHEELISNLIEAQAKIQKLEAVQKASSVADALEVTRDGGSKSNTIEECRSRPTFAYSSNTASGIIGDSSFEPHLLIDELKSKLKGCANGDFHNPLVNYTDDDFIVAYEYNGDFPDCDDDIKGDEEDKDVQPCILCKQNVWEDDEDLENMNEINELPLIPSPILNTPPYEYIFLTKENEAKVRIFLNPKLNQVFQEELQKLQKGEVQADQKEFTNASHMDANNQNHIVNSMSVSEVKNDASASNVIHCFDPSDVDLELKKVFMENPPITHRIVRRKSRRERGSSVPAVDSYYGTHDLNKVGHASYFIPVLTPSERKAIGWKPEYHYGHWKYSTLNVPNARANPVSLHPHPHFEVTTKSKHAHTTLLTPNPHHHFELDMSEPYLIEENFESENDENNSSPVCSGRHADPAFADDTLSFITLSGSNDSSQTCHVIPDKFTLTRVLKWIMPCLKSKTISDASVVYPNSSFEAQSKPHKSELDESGIEEKGLSLNETDNDSADDTIIETIVKPPHRLNSPTSHTHLSFAMGVSNGQFKNPSSHISGDPQSHHHSTLRDHNDNNNDVKSNHSHHHHHHHHHRLFHWKHLLSHGSRSNKSFSVVGGDVIESNPGSKTGPSEGPQDCENTTESIGREEEPSGNSEMHCYTQIEFSSTDTDEDENEGTGNNPNTSVVANNPIDLTLTKKTKQRKKLKSCRAYTKLLTLKDLGYQSESDTVENIENLETA